MTITFQADWLSKLMTAALSAAGFLQYFDWVNFLAMVSPENAAGIIGAYSAVKLLINGYTKATTVTVPKAPL